MLYRWFLLISYTLIDWASGSGGPASPESGIFCDTDDELHIKFNKLIKEYFVKNFEDAGSLYMESLGCLGSAILEMEEPLKLAVSEEVKHFVNRYSETSSSLLESVQRSLSVMRKRDTSDARFRVHRLVALLRSRTPTGATIDPSKVSYTTVVDEKEKRHKQDALVTEIRDFGSDAHAKGGLNKGVTNTMIVDALELIEKFALTDDYSDSLILLKLARDTLRIYSRACSGGGAGVFEQTACPLIPAFLRGYDTIEQVRDGLTRFQSLYSPKQADKRKIARGSTGTILSRELQLVDGDVKTMIGLHCKSALGSIDEIRNKVTEIIRQIIVMVFDRTNQSYIKHTLVDKNDATCSRHNVSCQKKSDGKLQCLAVSMCEFTGTKCYGAGELLRELDEVMKMT